jgi:hypothetical protein
MDTWRQALGERLSALGIRGPYFDPTGKPNFDWSGVPTTEMGAAIPQTNPPQTGGDTTFYGEGRMRGDPGTSGGVGPDVGTNIGNILGRVQVPPYTGGRGSGGRPDFTSEGRLPMPPEPQPEPESRRPPREFRPPPTRPVNPEPPFEFPEPPVIDPIAGPYPYTPPITIPPFVPPVVVTPPVGGGLRPPGIPGNLPGFPGLGDGVPAGAPQPPGFIGNIGGNKTLESLMRMQYDPQFVPSLGYFLGRGGR